MYHLQTHLLPITRFTKEELDDAVQEMKHALKMPPPSQPRRCDPLDFHDAPRIHNDQVKFTSEEFQRHWSRGVPVAITHVQLQGTWDPQYFVAEHERVVTLVDCETGKTRRFR